MDYNVFSEEAQPMNNGQTEPLLSVEGLTIEYQNGKEWSPAIRDVHLAIAPNEIHGLVGESGSGKSTLGAGILGDLPRQARRTAGHIFFEGRDLTTLNASEWQTMRGHHIAFVPQNPLEALNPTLTIGSQMAEVTQTHLGLSNKDALKLASEMLAQTNLPDPVATLKRYPHQLSGGQQQRVMIAMALSTRPKLLILDEPTTALDVTTRAVILELVRTLIREKEAAALYISHDLGTIAHLCDTVTVLYAGEVMETSPVQELFARPFHPYTAGLLASLPSRATGDQSRLSTIKGTAPALAERPTGCVFAPRCPVAHENYFEDKPPLEQVGSRTVRCWRWQEIAAGTLDPKQPPAPVALETTPPSSETVLSVSHLSKTYEEGDFWRRSKGVQAVSDVSFNVPRRSTIGIVGESGSGKTTLARGIVALTEADGGTLELLDRPISLHLADRGSETLKNLRYVFQNPGDSLNPYHTVRTAISRTIKRLRNRSYTHQQVEDVLGRVLESVGLTAAYADRYPGQLSGGEKQRVALARAFAAEPALVLADEPTSALDVSVQAVILNLLKDLRAQANASYIIISHDLDVIGYLADWIIVLYLGEIMEQGLNTQVRHAPMHPYTEALLMSVPQIPEATADGKPQAKVRTSSMASLQGDIPSPRHKPSGCPFHTRCPRFLGDICVTQAPPVRMGENGHEIRCHIPLDELRALQTGDA
jgi:peptide/nickel transport system ATP-binding protein